MIKKESQQNGAEVKVPANKPDHLSMALIAHKRMKGDLEGEFKLFYGHNLSYCLHIRTIASVNTHIHIRIHTHTGTHTHYSLT